jgi:hypothetical protein
MTETVASRLAEDVDTHKKNYEYQHNIFDLVAFLTDGIVTMFIYLAGV